MHEECNGEQVYLSGLLLESCLTSRAAEFELEALLVFRLRTEYTGCSKAVALR